MSFFQQVEERIRAVNTLLVVGVDPHGVATQDLDTWGEELVAATLPFAAAFKVNSAFYEAHGAAGLESLRKIIDHISIPVLLDVKRGDIGSTAAAQAVACYEALSADAVTLHPYLGRDAYAPFAGKGVFVLAKTSNPSAATFQDLVVDGTPLFLHVAREALSWGDDVGLVVGATAPEALRQIRAAFPDAWLLTPGVGAQGAGATETAMLGARSDGMGLLVPISRGISQAPSPAQAAERFASQLRPRPPLVQALIAADCVRHGSFTLRSGATSDIYVDLRRAIGHPELMGRITTALVEALAPLDYDRLAGVPLAGLPWAAAVAHQAQRPMIYPRPKAKEHGTKRRIEGPFTSGDRVVLIDDVATSGISLVEALERCRAEGLVVEHAVVTVDRQSGAAEALKERGVTLHSLFSLHNLR